ncbi:MAG: MFS transporter [Melioribacter sp.]|nr:MFS transporter [Melioribacter sp.]
MHKNFYLALLGIAIGGIGFGLITPVTVTLLEQNKAPAAVIGTITMIGYLSVVFFSRTAGVLIDKMGVRKILTLGLFIWSIGALAHVFWYIYPLLYFVKFLMGIGGTMIFVSTEVVINFYSNRSNRGRNINLYAVLLSIGIAVGSILIWTVKIEKWFPFVISSFIMLMVFLIQLLYFEEIRINKEQKQIERMSLIKMPLISLFTAALYGLFESSIIVVIPMFGLRNHFSVNQISYLMTSFVAGGIVLLYIVGYLSDIMNRKRLLLLIVMLLSLLIIFPTVNSNFLFLLFIFFVIGGIVPALYTIGLSYTIEKVENKFIAQANGYFIMMYGIGTIVGPVFGALLVDFNTRYGYWSCASLLCVLFLILFSKK